MSGAHNFSTFALSLKMRCPHCRKGNMYDGLLTVSEKCSICAFPLKEHDAGDGPAFFALFISCIIVPVAALILDALIHVPIWGHLLIWTPIVLILSIWLLRFFKAWLIVMQYKTRKGDFTGK